MRGCRFPAFVTPARPLTLRLFWRHHPDMTRISEQRKRALSARRHLSATYRRQASVHACRRLARLPVMQRAKRIGIYHPLASEIDPRPLTALLAGPTRRFYYPRTENNQVRFVRIRPGTRWRHSPLGMDEPTGYGHVVNILDVLILPLAAFDIAAHRIGLGGGFYDRTLAPIRHAVYRGPIRIGLAFSCQRLAEIEPAPWDVALSAVATEHRIHSRHQYQLMRCRMPMPAANENPAYEEGPQGQP